MSWKKAEPIQVDPSAGDTVLWFEFLLKPDLLKTHLKKPMPEPTALELIDKFLTIYPESQSEFFLNPETNTVESTNWEKPFDTVIGRKQIALKILTINVTSFLKWDLNVIEKNFPFQKQIQLMEDLCTITSGKIISLPLKAPVFAGILGSKVALEFAMFIYHRWILRVFRIFKDTITKKAHLAQNPQIPSDLNLSLRDEMFINILDPMPQASVDYLLNLAKIDSFPILNLTSILAMTTNSDHSSKNFELRESISGVELKTQIFYDLSQLYLFINSNDLAKKYALLCQENFNLLKKEYGKSSAFKICDITEEELKGVLLACGETDMEFGLLHRMNISVVNKYDKILDVLREDNIKMEIPFVHRKILELDVEALIGSQNYITKELEMNIVALNTVRFLINGKDIFHGTDFLKKYSDPDAFDLFCGVVKNYLVQTGDKDKGKIQKYILEGLNFPDNIMPRIDLSLKTLNLFSDLQLSEWKSKKQTQFSLPPVAVQTEWKIHESNSVRIETGFLEKKLINCTETSEVRKSLVKLVQVDPTKPLWVVNPSWFVPNSMKSILVSLSRGFIQDFAYILIAKSQEAASKNDYRTAITMLSVLKTETQRQEYVNTSLVVKLGSLVSWEILLMQILQVFHEWPRKVGDIPAIINKCKQCLVSVHNNSDGIIPRPQIMEHSALLLLNVNEMSPQMVTDKRNTTLQLTAEFAEVLLDFEGYRTGKKPQAWDLIIPMFETGTKRNALIPSVFIPFIKKLRDVTVLALVASLLVRFHNILRDEPSYDISSEFISLWPAALNSNSSQNPNMFNIRNVAEILGIVIKQALYYYPQNVAFLKMRGDLEYANGNNETAMKYYINSLITGTEYCTLHLTRPLLDDQLVRRMIKCSSNLGCHLQAAVFCQFMEEIDYGLAFKCLSERSANFSDAMDAYYSCIWDVTLLEFIVNLHGKKGEHIRKQQAIAYISQLELNANNNDEIKREAASIRKSKFLRSLASQYMI